MGPLYFQMKMPGEVFSPKYGNERSGMRRVWIQAATSREGSCLAAFLCYSHCPCPQAGKLGLPLGSYSRIALVGRAPCCCLGNPPLFISWSRVLQVTLGCSVPPGASPSSARLDTSLPKHSRSVGFPARLPVFRPCLGHFPLCDPNLRLSNMEGRFRNMEILRGLLWRSWSPQKALSTQPGTWLQLKLLSLFLLFCYCCHVLLPLRTYGGSLLLTLPGLPSSACLSGIL